MAGATARAIPHYPCQYIGMFRHKSYRDLQAHSSWFYFCTWYNYIPNFFLTLHSFLKLICELRASLSQFLCHVLHVATFLLSCCQSNTNTTFINTTWPFLPLLCVLSAPQERRDPDGAIWFGCVCQCVCNTFKQNCAVFLSPGDWQTGNCPWYLIKGLIHVLLKAVQRLQMIWLRRALISFQRRTLKPSPYCKQHSLWIQSWRKWVKFNEVEMHSTSSSLPEKNICNHTNYSASQSVTPLQLKQVISAGSRFVLTVQWTSIEEEERIVGLCRCSTTSPSSLWTCLWSTPWLVGGTSATI